MYNFVDENNWEVFILRNKQCTYKFTIYVFRLYICIVYMYTNIIMHYKFVPDVKFLSKLSLHCYNACINQAKSVFSIITLLNYNV